MDISRCGCHCAVFVAVAIAAVVPVDAAVAADTTAAVAAVVTHTCVLFFLPLVFPLSSPAVPQILSRANKTVENPGTSLLVAPLDDPLSCQSDLGGPPMDRVGQQGAGENHGSPQGRGRMERVARWGLGGVGDSAGRVP